MRKIQRYVECIDEELESAKDYAEKYLELKAVGHGMQNRYKEMAGDELKHAGYLHDHAVEEINILKNVYTPPVAMEEEWNRSHKEYIEKVAWIRQMLAM